MYDSKVPLPNEVNHNGTEEDGTITTPRQNNENTPTKQSVSNQVFAFTSSFLTAAPSTAVSLSPTRSTKSESLAIELSSKSPLKRSNNPSTSPTRKGARATKSSPHRGQGTPPQSPPTPHKIICQATVETLEQPQVVENGCAGDGSGDEGQGRDNISARLRVRPKKKCSPSSKLISALSPKKNMSSAKKKLVLEQTFQKSPKLGGGGSTANNEAERKPINMSARRNLTNSMLTSNDVLDNISVKNGSTIAGPKKR